MKVEGLDTYSTTKVLRYKTYIYKHVALTIKKVKYLIVYNACKPVLQMNECSYHEGGGEVGEPKGGGICAILPAFSQKTSFTYFICCTWICFVVTLASLAFTKSVVCVSMCPKHNLMWRFVGKVLRIGTFIINRAPPITAPHPPAMFHIFFRISQISL